MEKKLDGHEWTTLGGQWKTKNIPTLTNQDVGLDGEHHKTAWTWRGQEKDNRADMIEDV